MLKDKIRMTKDEYITLAAPAFGEFKDRGSKFLAYTYPAFSEAECLLRLEEVKKLHPKARHHCYAWRLGTEGTRYRANDDGEPSGTAGRPMLGQIDSAELTNVVVIVVRYFGGTLLGASGLIQAYRESAAAAFATATKVNKTIEDIFRITFDYSLMSDVMNALKKLQIVVLRQEFTTQGEVDFSVRLAEVDTTLLKLKAAIAKVSTDHATVIDHIEGQIGRAHV